MTVDGNAAANLLEVAKHRPERHHAGAAGDEQQGPAAGRLPDEVAADRAAELETIPRPELVGQVRRHLAVADALDGQLELCRAWCRRERVAALRLITVLGGQPDVDVLPREVAGPVRDVRAYRLDAWRLRDDLHGLRDLPGQSPQYRCSRHGSP